MGRGWGGMHRCEDVVLGFSATTTQWGLIALWPRGSCVPCTLHGRQSTPLLRGVPQPLRPRQAHLRPHLRSVPGLGRCGAHLQQVRQQCSRASPSSLPCFPPDRPARGWPTRRHSRRGQHTHCRYRLWSLFCPCIQRKKKHNMEKNTLTS